MFQWNKILYKIYTVSAITHGSPDPPQTLPTVAEIHQRSRHAAASISDILQTQSMRSKQQCENSRVTINSLL